MIVCVTSPECPMQTHLSAVLSSSVFEIRLLRLALDQHWLGHALIKSLVLHCFFPIFIALKDCL